MRFFFIRNTRLVSILNCLNVWMSEWFLIWRFNLVCADGGFYFYCYFLDNRWVSMMWPLQLTGRWKPIIYLSLPRVVFWQCVWLCCFAGMFAADPQLLQCPPRCQCSPPDEHGRRRGHHHRQWWVVADTSVSLDWCRAFVQWYVSFWRVKVRLVSVVVLLGIRMLKVWGEAEPVSNGSLHWFVPNPRVHTHA